MAFRIQGIGIKIATISYFLNHNADISLKILPAVAHLPKVSTLPAGASVEIGEKHGSV